MGTTADSSFLIDVLRGEPAALEKAAGLDRRRERKLLTTPVLYEVATGIAFRRSRSEAAAFRAIASRFEVVPFDEPAAVRAAEIQSELMRAGRMKPAVDVMVAGIALAGGHAVLTRDRDIHDIARAVGLRVETY